MTTKTTKLIGLGRFSLSKPLALAFTLVLAILAFSASSASAAEPWWHLESGSQPTNIPPEGKGEGKIVVTAADLGDADANGNSTLEDPAGSGVFGTPVKIVDTLPPGLKATGIGAEANNHDGIGTVSENVGTCELTTLTCEYTEVLPDYNQIQVVISVKAEPEAHSGEVNRATVSGGGAPHAVSVTRPIAISATPTPYGVENYEMTPETEVGGVDTQAGSHPFQLTTTLDLNQTLVPGEPPAQAKDLHFNLPPGLVGNPTVFPQCSEALFLKRPAEGTNSNVCPGDTAVGVAAFTINLGHSGSVNSKTPIVVPLFNLTPAVGEPARFGFYFDQSPVYLDTSVRTGEGYGVRVSVDNITQQIVFVSSRVTFWGVPGEQTHDNARGWSCIDDGKVIEEAEDVIAPCPTGAEQHPAPLLSLPTSCTGALETSVETDSWKERGAFQTFEQNPSELLPALDGCTKLPFKPSIHVSPDVQEASKPSGLNVDVHVPQQVDLDSEGLSASDVNDITVTLPEGLILNPSAADGLTACPLLTGREVGKEAQEDKGEVAGIDLETPQPANCPNSSKIATVTIHSPLLPKPLEGFVYLASPQNFAGLPQNPFSKHVAQYIVAEDKEAGVLVKLPGYVELGDEPGVSGLQPGQIRSTFANQPQLPFEDAELHFFGGERAPLATPSHCGAYTTNASYAPWSGNEAVGAQGSFAITSGAGDTACPGSSLPFAASLSSGTTNNNAGGFTPLTTTLSRPSGNQNIQSVTLHYPPGLSGLLTGVELCAEAQANAGTCGPNSQIGETIVSVGVGGEPFTVVGGKAYITGPYEGAPFGLSVVNPAKAGPFNLQEGRPVVVRAKIEVDPHTAALTITTNPSMPGAIPTIIEGFPLEIQHVNVNVNRPGFTFNPTNCTPAAVTGTIDSAEGASSPVSDPFQVTNCASLKFAPKFAASTSGKTSKAEGASLHVDLTYPQGAMGTYANIKSVKVELPKQLPSELKTLQKACTAKQFDANPAGCPSTSIVGHAKAITPLIPVPLEGPAYFVSNGNEAFPNLIMVLQGYGVTIDLVGDTFISKTGITSSTFKTVPDQPVGSFELTLPEQSFSALAANGNLCTEQSSLKMPTDFVAQNGAELKQDTQMSVTGCKPAITVKSHKVKGKTATITVSVPSAGKLVATGSGLSKGSGKSSKAGTVTVKLHLTKAETDRLSKHRGRKLKAKIKLTFTPTKGSKLATTTTVLVG
jgi:ribosomal protein L11